MLYRYQHVKQHMVLPETSFLQAVKIESADGAKIVRVHIGAGSQ